MFRNIIEEAPVFPPFLSESAISLMASLLRKEPSARPQSAAEIMIHPFFAGMDWDALLAREVPPPWAPPIVESNFDNEFTGLPLNFDEHAEGPGLSRVRSRASCYLE